MITVFQLFLHLFSFVAFLIICCYLRWIVRYEKRERSRTRTVKFSSKDNEVIIVVTTSNCFLMISTPLVGQFSLQKLSSKSVLESSRTSPHPRGFSRTVLKSLALAL